MKRKISSLMILILLFTFFCESSGNLKGFLPLAEEKKVKELQLTYNKKENLDIEGYILVGTKLALKDFDVTLVYNTGETLKVASDSLVEPTYHLKQDMIPYGASVSYGVDVEYKGTDIVDSKPVLIGKYYFQTRAYKLKRISAKWGGKSLLVGTEIDKKEVIVNGYYDLIDSRGRVTESTKTISSSDFNIEPDTIQSDTIKTGVKNTVKVSHKGFETFFEISGYGSKGIVVDYSGPKSLVVGESIDPKKIKVTQIFGNGEQKKVTDFTIKDGEIKVVGVNTITISYEGETKQLTITGIEKRPEKISAKYDGGDLSVGSLIDVTKITVTATNNDKSTEIVTGGITVKPDKITAVGSNTITVFYKDLKDTIKIKGTEVLPVNIMAMYNGGMVIEGSLIKKSEISVTAYYPDGKSLQISDFDLSTETMNTIGMQEVIVSYKGAEAKIYVPVTARLVTSISVTYKGGALVQFSSIDRKDIVVTAKYNDGKTENVSDYTISNTMAAQVGQNKFTIFYGGHSKDLIVETLARLILGRGSLKADISGDEYSTTVTAFIENQSVREGIKLETQVVEKADIARAVRRVNKTDKFLAFEIQIDDFQFDENKYMITEATIPDGFNPANVGIYYTPDKTKTMVQLTGGLVSSKLYRFYVYRSGTYIIMEKEETDIGRQELREEDNRTPFLVASVPTELKVKEKKGIKAFLLFAPFKNDGFKYESGDEDILTVSKEGLITAKRAGETSIVVSSEVGGYSQTYDLTVKR